MNSLTAHSSEIERFMQTRYRGDNLDRLEAFLVERGVFRFRALGSGLFPAVQTGASASGYQNVWVRDNVFVAYAHAENGRLDVAVAVIRALATYFSKHLFRFDAVIAGTVDRNDPMQRVNVRFDGTALEELPQKWAHAQNDALGYFVWLFCTLASKRAFAVSGEDLVLLERFLAYFQAIRFWQDEDSGHWEETRKVEASSIGVVTGGLNALHTLLRTAVALREAFGSTRIENAIRLAAELGERGRQAIDAILPAECAQPGKERRYDAALLFLVFPIRTVDPAMADEIVSDVVNHLRGDVGIRRYVGDSYWCADYRELLSPQARSSDFSDDMERRDRLLKPGQEAQWCIFDPIVSAIHGDRYRRYGEAADLEKHVHYLNRSLAQITETLQCPEAYFLERGRYAPNDNVPLLWTEANLWLALSAAKRVART
jgi:GH15 family glucan-1,4-alpha-glucosidase